MKKNTPLVSIGLPVYNGEDHLEEVLDSLLKQKYKNFEIIISDNKSTDRTSAICKKFAEKNNKIFYFKQKKNIGAINNFNFVLSKAKGSYFMWAAADDLWHKDYLKILVKLLLNHPKHDLVITEYAYFSQRTYDKRRIKLRRFIGYQKIESILNFLNNGLSLMNDVVYYGLYKTKKLKQLGGHVIDENRKIVNYLNNDIYATFRLLIRGVNFFLCKKVLFYKRDSGVNLDVYTEMKNLNLTKTTLQKFFGYLIVFPIIFFYDSYIFTILTFKSSFSWREKRVIFFYIIKSFFVREYYHYQAIAFGFFHLVNGLTIRFFRFHKNDDK